MLSVKLCDFGCVREWGENNKKQRQRHRKNSNSNTSGSSGGHGGGSGGDSSGYGYDQGHSHSHGASGGTGLLSSKYDSHMMTQLVVGTPCYMPPEYYVSKCMRCSASASARVQCSACAV